jgi:hypothetical protein
MVTEAIRLAGIQPGYLPWLGYFDQMRRVDVFVLADEMQFSSSGWAHRNRVRGPHGAAWLTLPARPQRDQRICEVMLDPTVPWAPEHAQRLHHFYHKSPFAPDLLAQLWSEVDARATRMIDASIPIIRFLAARFGITTPLVVSSERGLERAYEEQFSDRPGPTERIIAIMKALGATELLEGETGRGYLDVELCAHHGIRVEFQHYVHPTYRQLHEPFVSHLSALDLLLCAGETEARRILAHPA